MKQILLGLTLVLISIISSNKLDSYLCLPLVSTKMISNYSFLNKSTPYLAIIAGLVSV